MSCVVNLQEHALDPRDELGALIDEAKGAGAVVSFVGIARSQSSAGRPIDRLVLEHHPTLTRQSLDTIVGEAARRFDVSHLRVIHRCGEIRAGEPILFAGAASRHRRAAFEAADYLMDRLKTEAVFWKREVGAAGSEWIEPSAADHERRDRWG
jgi:molybdopterin synthase catalytic subunit